jgi:hypothetical protein
MPLIPCPDCGREVSSAAPACIHCGRPLAAPAAPDAAPAVPAPHKPMAGVVTALVLGVLMIVWVLGREPARSDEMRDVNSVVNAVHTLGNTVLIIGALLSLAGHRAGNRVVRTLSVLMIPAIIGTMVLAWGTIASLTAREFGDRDASGVLGLITAISTLIQVAPWLLYLYLFRKSRYP